MSDFNFDWNSLNGGVDPFQQKQKFTTDDRFYKLTKDKDGNGAAIIRFLPDGELKELNGKKSMGTVQQVIKINAQNSKNGKRRFVSEYSPRTIGLKDPFYEEFGRLWNEGKQEEAKKFGSTTRYIANIYIVKDPACPANEGKVFLLDMSKTMADGVQKYLQPSEQEIALGTQPVQLFNPLSAGSNFVLKCRMGANGIPSYDSSAPAPQPSAVFENNEQAINFIKTNCYKLSEFTSPETYLSYDELKEKLTYVKFEDGPGAATPSITTVQTQTTQTQVQPAQTEFVAAAPQAQPSQTQAQPAQTTQPQKSKEEEDIDDLLAGLV